MDNISNIAHLNKMNSIKLEIFTSQKKLKKRNLKKTKEPLSNEGFDQVKKMSHKTKDPYYYVQPLVSYYCTLFGSEDYLRILKHGNYLIQKEQKK